MHKQIFFLSILHECVFYIKKEMKLTFSYFERLLSFFVCFTL